jgi:hypothetical protein
MQATRWRSAFNPNTEVGGTAFAAIIGSTSRRAILDSINWIQPLRSPTSCAAKHGTAYGPSNFGIRVQDFPTVSRDDATLWRHEGTK